MPRPTPHRRAARVARLAREAAHAVPRTVRAASDDDAGVALVSTIGLTAVVSILVVGLLATTITVIRQTDRDVDWHAALAAAEAGMDDLVQRLNADQYYWQQVEAQRDECTAPSPPNPALCDWVTLPDFTDPDTGAVTPSGAAYRYDVDETVRENGAITITSTGRVGGTTRTVEATVRRRSFLDYLYFTEYETRPPAAYTIWPPREEDKDNTLVERNSNIAIKDRWILAIGADAQAEAEDQCAHHRYGTTRPDPQHGLIGRNGTTVVSREAIADDDDPTTLDGRHPYCHEPHWVNGNDFFGHFHTNDALPIRDDDGGGNGRPVFNGPRTTSSWGQGTPGWLDVQDVVNGNAAGNPVFRNQTDEDGDPVVAYAKPLEMPPDNKELLQIAAPSDPTLLRGCVFYGPTRIRLDDSDVHVDSPRTAEVDPGECGLPSDGSGRLSLPSDFNGVIYVENAPEGVDCTGWTGDVASLPLDGDAGADYRKHLVDDAGRAKDDVTPYKCRDGDAFVEGELEGRLTIAAAHDILITDHLTYDGVTWPNAPTSDESLLGLVANRFVYLFHPVDCEVWVDEDGVTHKQDTNGAAADTTPWVCLDGDHVDYRNDGTKAFETPVVYAAILAVNYSLTIQNSPIGDHGLGDLRVFGTIAQQYRGNLGTAAGNRWPGCGGECKGGGTGYGKEFRYDDRLQYLSPPHFLEPASTAWGPVTFTEQHPAYEADGTPRTG